MVPPVYIGSGGMTISPQSSSSFTCYVALSMSYNCRKSRPVYSGAQ